MKRTYEAPTLSKKTLALSASVLICLALTAESCPKGNSGGGNTKTSSTPSKTGGPLSFKKSIKKHGGYVNLFGGGNEVDAEIPDSIGVCSYTIFLTPSAHKFPGTVDPGWHAATKHHKLPDNETAGDAAKALGCSNTSMRRPGEQPTLTAWHENAPARAFETLAAGAGTLALVTSDVTSFNFAPSQPVPAAGDADLLPVAA